jgi:hypothetical protein
LQAFAGQAPEKIAASVGMHIASVRAIIRSPLAQAALDAMREKAEASVTNVPLRMQLESELNDDASTARRVQRGIMVDPNVDPRARLVATRHFMDRVVFSTPPVAERQLDYKDVLRRMDQLEGRLDVSPSGTLIIADQVQVNQPHCLRPTRPVRRAESVRRREAAGVRRRVWVWRRRRGLRRILRRQTYFLSWDVDAVPDWRALWRC